MKAVVYERYGPPEVLRLVEMAKPAPKDHDVLIRVRATTVTKGDVRMRSFTVPRAQWIPARLYLGIRKPRRPILGMELAGEVEAVGSNVTRFKVGDPVFASTFKADFGGHAEYKCMPEDGLIAIKPDHVSYGEAAAAVGAGMTALVCMKKADFQPGQTVLIYGASGAVGTNAVQLAHHWGAVVTGVCSAANLDLVRGLGADHVIDYTQEDFTQLGDTYDVIFDAVAKFPSARAQKALKPAGIYLNVHQDSNERGGRNMLSEVLLALKDLLEAGAIRPVIDRTYPLDQIVEAHRYVDTGRKKGNVVIAIA